MKLDKRWEQLGELLLDYSPAVQIYSKRVRQIWMSKRPAQNSVDPQRRGGNLFQYEVVYDRPGLSGLQANGRAQYRHILNIANTPVFFANTSVRLKIVAE